MVRIAHLTSPVGSSIYLSIDTPTKGYIYVGINSFSSQKYQLISTDIFKMVLMLRSKPNRNQLNERTIPLLYNKWGEEFWRIKDDQKV
jgi:hypothetical protein